MNIDDKNDQGPAETQKPVAFCQNCGKSLSEATARIVGPAVYCEPCLATRLTGAPPEAARSGFAADPNFVGIRYTPTPSVPNPGLAALLGFIPGVGAMYNEQYAKGLVHLMVFAVLISLAHAVEIFGFFAFGWICYMVIEAHHTARARRDGTPLPNPFGLNDIGERLGFGRAWPSATAAGPAPAGAAATAAAPAGFQADPTSASAYAPPSTAWGAPAEAYDPSAPYAEAYSQSFSAPYGAQPAAGYVPYAPPYSAPFSPPQTNLTEPAFVPKPNRFPAGAVWLIGLGTIFLLSTTGIFQTLFGWSLVGFVLIGMAVWIFLRKMMDTGIALGDDGSAGYSLRVVRALGPAVWVFMVGLLLLLNEFGILPWRRSWPLFIILAGVMSLVQRAAFRASSASFVPEAAYPVPGAGSAGSPWSPSHPFGSVPSTSAAPVNPGSAASEGATDLHEGGN